MRRNHARALAALAAFGWLTVAAAQSPAVNPKEADAAKAQAAQQLAQPLNNQPVWSEVRSGAPQYTSIPGRETSVDEVNKAMEYAAAQELKGILGVTSEPLVSTDFNHNPMSATFHLTQTQIVDGRLVRVLAWYDNEWGFSNRMADTAVAMAKVM